MTAFRSCFVPRPFPPRRAGADGFHGFGPLIAALLLANPALAVQTTWYVDGSGTAPGSGTPEDPFTSIQFALAADTTLAGDTVLVMPGMYVEALDLLGKAVVLRSLGGAVSTVVQAPGDEDRATLRALQHEPSSTRVEGFTLRGGAGEPDPSGLRPPSGGCLYSRDSAPHLVDCVLEGGDVAGDGGGVFLLDSGAWLENCVVQHNDCLGLGAGLFAEQSSVRLGETLIRNNGDPFSSTPLGGGGIAAKGSELTMLNCGVQDNFCEGSGAGIAASLSTLRLLNTSVSGNYHLVGSGAGIDLNQSWLRMECGTIRANASNEALWGGGLALLGGELHLARVTIEANASSQGGGVHVQGLAGLPAVARIEGGFLRDNRAWPVPLPFALGGALSVVGNADVVCRRTVFQGNQAIGPGSRAGAVHGPAVLEHCDLLGNEAEVGAAAAGAELRACIVWDNQPDGLAPGTVATWSDVQGGWPGEGNLDVNPLLNEAFKLAPDSPCIDAGPPSEFDLDGSVADIGVFPFVDCDGDGLLDADQIAQVPSLDANGNGILDVCECLAQVSCVSLPNSTGAGAVLANTGSLSVAENSFGLQASGCPAEVEGLFFYGSGQQSVTFGDGRLCVLGPYFRLVPSVSTDASGVAVRAVDLTQPPQPGGLVLPGSSWTFQFWFRDPGFGAHQLNTSSALRLTFCP